MISETMSEPREKTDVLKLVDVALVCTAFVEKRFVDVALVIVAVEASKLTKWEVEEAKIPDCAQIAEEVAAVIAL